MEAAIHLVTKETFLKENDVNKSQLIIDKLIESCIELDISIFEPYIVNTTQSDPSPPTQCDPLEKNAKEPSI